MKTLDVPLRRRSTVSDLSRLSGFLWAPEQEENACGNFEHQTTFEAFLGTTKTTHNRGTTNLEADYESGIRGFFT